MTAKLTILVFAYTILLTTSSCRETSREGVSGDEKIASVGSMVLYESELKELTQMGIAAEDSTAIANGYVEQWIRRGVLITEAESSLSSNLDIERLVKDYRSSLLINNYEQQYITKRLDTTVTQEQLEVMYEEQKDNFAVATKLYQVKLASFDAKTRGLEAFYRDWQKSNNESIHKYTSNNSIKSKLDDNWLSSDALQEYIPATVFNKSAYKAGASLQKNHDGIEYFVKVIDVIDKGETPPLAYVKEKMTEVILQRRKKTLLQKLESDLYRKALSTNKIRVYKK